MVIRPLTASALSGITAAAERFDGAAERVRRLAAAPSTDEGAATVQISARAREGAESADTALTSGLEGAMVDTRVAKYASIANLKVLQTGIEIEQTAAQLLKPKRDS